MIMKFICHIIGICDSPMHVVTHVTLIQYGHYIRCILNDFQSVAIPGPNHNNSSKLVLNM